MRHISVATKNELIMALAQRYREGSREEKSRILDQVCSNQRHASETCDALAPRRRQATGFATASSRL